MNFNLQQDQVEKYMTKYLIYSILWSMAGDGRLKSRQELGDFIKGITDVPLPPTANMLIIDYEVIRSRILQVFIMFKLADMQFNQYLWSGTLKLGFYACGKLILVTR